jgi:heat shock protein HslJ
MYNILKFLILLLFSGLCLAADGPQVGLETSDWHLDRYLAESGQMTAVLPDTVVTASFMGGKLSGSAGCNRYFGNYNSGAENQLSISTHIGATMMACAPPVAKQERQYLDRLPVVVVFQLEGESLRLFDKDHQAVLEYSAVKPLALEGTHWQASGINNGKGGVVSSANTQLATARFKDGKVGGHAGCNTFNASYEIKGEQITMGPAMTTRMHCAEPDGIMDQEQEYLQALSRVRVYELTDTGLKLRDEKGSLQVNFVAGDKVQQ